MSVATSADDRVSAGVGLRTRFGRLWLATAASNLADGILFAGLPVIAMQVTDSPALIAGVAIAIQLPMALAALPAGVLADRHDRRRLLAVGNAVRALGLFAAATAVLFGDVRLAVVYAVAALAGGSEIVVDTTAQTTVPALVDRKELGRAHARLGGTQVVLNDAVGAPLGSLLAGMGVALFLATPLLLFALAAATVLRLRLPAGVPEDVEAPRPTTRQSLSVGVRYLTGNLLLRRLALAGCVFNFANMAFVALLPVYVTNELGLPPAAYGMFLTAAAAGGVLGSLVADRVLQRLGLARLLQFGSLAIAAVFAALGLVPHLVVAVVGIVLAGALAMTWNIGIRVLRQTIVPDALLGRVTATVAFIALIAAPFGGLLGGLVAEQHGLRWPAAVAVVGTTIAFVLLRAVTAARIDAATEAVATTAAAA